MIIYSVIRERGIERDQRETEEQRDKEKGRQRRIGER